MTLREEFLAKIRAGEYISRALYLKLLKSDSRELLPGGFNLERYNEGVLQRKYEQYKGYFEGMYRELDPGIRLDKEQIKAILADEDYALIIAGAGTGKTTTQESDE